jgi:flagellar motility protein MotE (MotC chaperone)
MRFLLLLLLPLQALALTQDAKEWLAISAKLEPVQCEKRQLRRQMVMAQVQDQPEEMRKLRAREGELNRDKETARLEQRLAELEKRMSDGKGGMRDPQDLDAISLQQRQAFYRCE